MTHLIDERSEWNSYANDENKGDLHRAGWNTQVDLILDPLSTDISETKKGSKADAGLRKTHHKAAVRTFFVLLSIFLSVWMFL